MVEGLKSSITAGWLVCATHNEPAAVSNKIRIVEYFFIVIKFNDQWLYILFLPKGENTHAEV